LSLRDYYRSGFDGNTLVEDGGQHFDYETTGDMSGPEIQDSPARQTLENREIAKIGIMSNYDAIGLGRFFKQNMVRFSCKVGIEYRDNIDIFSQEMSDHIRLNVLIGKEGRFYQPHAVIVAEITISFFMAWAAYPIASRKASAGT